MRLFGLYRPNAAEQDIPFLTVPRVQQYINERTRRKKKASARSLKGKFLYLHFISEATALCCSLGGERPCRRSHAFFRRFSAGA